MSPNKVKLAVGRCLLAQMDATKWLELGLITGTSELIVGHGRLLRALHFGDDDYAACVHDIVPALLDERLEPTRRPWEGPAPTAVAPRTRFPNLDEVAEYIDLPAWLAEHDEQLFNHLFDASGPTMPDGTVLSAAEAAAARLGVAEMHRQIERIRRDHANDPESAIGQTKELLETVCKTILGMTGDAEESSPLAFPQLVKRTLLHLGIDPTQLQENGDGVQAHAAKRVMGGISTVLNGAAELRNARGTGHGRSGTPRADDALARLVVGSALPAAVYLIEVFESRTSEEASPEFQARPGSASSGIKAASTVIRLIAFQGVVGV